jgi:hypothetical protein
MWLPKLKLLLVFKTGKQNGILYHTRELRYYEDKRR